MNINDLVAKIEEDYKIPIVNETDVCTWYRCYKQQVESSMKIFPDPSDCRRYESVESYVVQGCLDCKGLEKDYNCYEIIR